ncbi:DUF4253 domain-containing protein [Streptomyces anulatus]|uniref:DUF4253 domain-containing protein n=1 Tax=Streptomyces TaxID=1883 RepID=UPI0037D83AB3
MQPSGPSPQGAEGNQIDSATSEAARAEAVAAEHQALCPDDIARGHHETLRTYAADAVLDRHVWHFWWN